MWEYHRVKTDRQNQLQHHQVPVPRKGASPGLEPQAVVAWLVQPLFPAYGRVPCKTMGTALSKLEPNTIECVATEKTGKFHATS